MSIFNKYSEKKCPCKREKPNLLAQDDSIKKVIVTVHGTFSKHAIWTYYGKLIMSFEKMPQTQINRFCWSGGNSHSKRLLAAEELAEHLTDLIDKFPNAQFYITGHSHGGNVAMYALKMMQKVKTCDKIKGIISISTPFLNIKKRKENYLIQYSKFLVFALFAIELALILLYNAGQETRQSIASYDLYVAVLITFSIMLMTLFISILTHRRNNLGFWTSLKLLFKKDLDNEKLLKELEELELLKGSNGFPNQDQTEANKFDISNTKTLVIRPYGDEVSMGLMIAQLFSWVHNKFLKWMANLSQYSVFWFLWTFFTALFRMIPIFWFSKDMPTFFEEDNLEKFPKFSDGIKYWFFATIKLIGLKIFIFLKIALKFALLCLIIFSIGKYLFPHTITNTNNLIQGIIEFSNKHTEFGDTVSIVLVIGMLFLGVWGSIHFVLGLLSILGDFILILSALPFGWDAIYLAHFSSTTIESSPPGSVEIFHPFVKEKEPKDKEKDDMYYYLNKPYRSETFDHSEVYHNKDVISKIKSWIDSF